MAWPVDQGINISSVTRKSLVKRSVTYDRLQLLQARPKLTVLVWMKNKYYIMGPGPSTYDDVAFLSNMDPSVSLPDLYL